MTQVRSPKHHLHRMTILLKMNIPMDTHIINFAKIRNQDYFISDWVLVSKNSVTSVEFLIRRISSFWTPKAYQYPTRGYSRVILALQIESIPLVNFTNYTSSQVRKQISRFWKGRNSNLILAE